MKEIKLNDCSYLRDKVTKAKVDDTKLEFRNGVAIAKASIYALDYAYLCYGLINEDFQEMFANKLSSRYECNLMFFPYNKEILRFGDNDFIVTVDCTDGNDCRSWTEIRHIRIVDGFPTLINRLAGSCTKTTDETVAIMDSSSGKALYSIERGEVITPSLDSIEESSTYCGVFDVMTRVIPRPSESFYHFVDYLCFKIDSEGKRVSAVLSSLDNGYVECKSNLSVRELLSERAEELSFRTESFTELVSSFERKDFVLDAAGYVKKK